MCGFFKVCLCVCLCFVMSGVVMCGFFNVWVCVCVGFAMCVCVSVALVFQHAKRMRHIKLSSVACQALKYFDTVFH